MKKSYSLAEIKMLISALEATSRFVPSIMITEETQLDKAYQAGFNDCIDRIESILLITK